MLLFDTSNIDALKDFLYKSCVHDAVVKAMKYYIEEDQLIIELFNSCFNTKMVFTFCGIENTFSVKSNLFGSRETVNALVVEEFSYLQRYIPNYDLDNKDSIYLLFEMFSGDQFHIVCKKLIVEVTNIVRWEGE